MNRKTTIVILMLSLIIAGLSLIVITEVLQNTKIVAKSPIGPIMSMENCIQATGACDNESQGYFLSYYRPTSRRNKNHVKTANNKVFGYFQAQTSFPAQRPVPYGAVFQSRRRGRGADVLRNLKNAKFEGFVIFLRCFKHFCKSSVKTKIKNITQKTSYLS